MESGKKIKHLERRVERLELFSHPPIDLEKRISSLEDAHMKLYDLLTEFIKEK